MTTKLTADDCRNVSWRLVEETGTYRRYVGHGEHPVTGVPIEVQKTEYLAEDALLAMNAAERSVNDRRRWSSGMGSDKGGNMPMVHVGRIPMNVYASVIAPRAKDRDFLRWWLNRDENAPFRTRSGRI